MSELFDPQTELTDWGFLKLMFWWMAGESYTDIQKRYGEDVPPLEKMLKGDRAFVELSVPIEIKAPDKISRVTITKVIDRFSQKYLTWLVHLQIKHFTRTIEALRGQSLDNIPAAVRNFFSKLEELSPGTLDDIDLRDAGTVEILQHCLQDPEEAAWDVIKHVEFENPIEELVEFPKDEQIYSRPAINFARDRHKRLKGYSREKMTPHAAHFHIMDDLYRRSTILQQAQPRKSFEDWSDEERLQYRYLIGLFGTQYIAHFFLNPNFVGVGGYEKPTGSSGSGANP